MKKLLILFLLLTSTVPLAGKVKLPALIGSHMVLQRDTLAGIWGETAPGRRVSVRPSWSRECFRTTAGPAGRWAVRIPTPGAGGPHRIVIDDGDRTVLDSVLIGEVWICSGQSNMALTLHGEQGEHVEGSLRTLLEAGRYPSIRLFKMGNVSAAEPQDDCPGTWAVPDWAQISDFSAVAYHFGRMLTDALDVPVGLISVSWGASSIEAWIPRESLDKLERTDSIRFPVRQGMMKQKIPAALYNGMIHPLQRFTARGFIWYQGEGNRANYEIYDKLSAEMVRAWRAGWNNPDMSFYCVELAPYKYDDPQGIDRPLLVEAQHRALRLIPRSGIAGTLDLGDSTTIHPPHKREVGQRLALLALTADYGVRGIEARGPVFQSAEFGRDGSVVVTFADAPFGLRAEGAPEGFELCGEDRVFHPAEARIVNGRSDVCLTSPLVPHPVAARYGFRNWCRGNLYNTSGIPAAPFRTDGENPEPSRPAWDDPRNGNWEGFERIEIPSSADGSIQRAYFRKASGPHPRPLVVSLHTWSGDYTQRDPLAAEAAARNWNYIHPDFRGPNDRPEACGSPLVLADLEDAVHYAVNNGNTDPAEVHVIGVSGGGYATLLAYMTMRYPVRSFSAWAPISDLAAWYEQSIGRRQRYAGDIRNAVSAGRTPDMDEARRRSPLHMPYPAGLRKNARLFIYEGIHDGYKGSVPITHALDIYNKVAQAQDAPDSCLVSVREALRLVAARQNPERDTLRTLGGRGVHLARSYGNVSLTIFEGGHEQLPQALSPLPVGNPYEKKTWRIYAVGDSNGEKHDGWVDRLKTLLPRAAIHNNSRSGRTIGFDNNGDPNLNALHSIDSDLADADRHFGNGGCDAVVVCLGTNDVKAIFADRQPEITENFGRLLEHVSRSKLVRRSKPLCIFVTPPPMDDRKAEAKYAGGNERLGSLVPRLAETARKYGWEVVDIYHPLQSIFGIYTSDGVHMNPDGQQIVAREIADCLAGHL
ncbi:GDSL-type esterase/lipase family protein [Alistipes senegalensis]|uniref:GDSL-type esterase/lipase family protein n=1 Tax=Alistipes senegalensis TaxID=1288121 RepID=UPI0018A9BDFE|nr:GDSL-type esterase/lipase family protein [Alistipes senegalensis]